MNKIKQLLKISEVHLMLHVFSFSAQCNHCVDDLSVPVLVLAVLGLLHALCNR